MARPILVGAFMVLFVTVVQLYTWITLPIYFFSQKPWQRRARSTRNRVKRMVSLHSLNPNNGLSLEEEEEECLMSETYVRDYAIHREHEIIKLNTVTEMLDMVADIHGANSRALGEFLYLSTALTLKFSLNAFSVGAVLTRQSSCNRECKQKTNLFLDT